MSLERERAGVARKKKGTVLTSSSDNGVSVNRVSLKSLTASARFDSTNSLSS